MQWVEASVAMRCIYHGCVQELHALRADTLPIHPTKGEYMR